MIEWIKKLLQRYWRSGAAKPTPVVTRRQIFTIPHLSKGAAPVALSWTDCHPTTIQRFKAEMRCSNGHAVTLKNHRVDRDGLVSPSVVCREPLCGFHEFVRLEGWTAGPIG